jgi:U4/U6.U5 tri-snRNP-associated protein 1
MADAVSIAETNKIRIALGLKPLAEPASNGGGLAFKDGADSGDSSEDEEQGSTLESRQALAGDNWQELEEERLKQVEKDRRRDAIKKARDHAQRLAKLSGKGLGDADEADDQEDALAWLKGQKKRQKKIAKKMERELAEREREAAAAADHTGEDLAGVRVAHEIDDFDGGDAVLTLKDTTVDANEEEGDELENVDLVEREKLQEKLDSKKRKIVYNPNDNLDGENGILSQYDEEINGKKRKRFTLDGKGSTEEEKQARREEVGEKIKKMTVSLDIIGMCNLGYFSALTLLNTNEYVADAEPVNDYLDSSTIKIKKPKKSKKKSTRQRQVDEEDEIFPVAVETEPSMEVDSGTTVTAKRPSDDYSFVDDEDLQASLAAQRRKALKKRKKITPEQLARQMREEDEAEAANTEMKDGDDDEPGLVLDETSEFVANLQKPEIPVPRSKKTAPAAIKRESESPSAESVDNDGDIDMDSVQVKKEQSEEPQEKEEEEDLTSTGISADSTLNIGLGATLNMLTSRGLLNRSADDIASSYRSQQLFLAEKARRAVAADQFAKSSRERDRGSGRMANMSAREKEEHARHENKNRELAETRRMAELFNESYKPKVELKYVDEYGRSLDQKEAFKHLSHQFHGKGSGKGKTEKLLKKIEEEKRREQQGILDGGERRAGLDSAAGEVGRREGKAGVRLQ